MFADLWPVPEHPSKCFCDELLLRLVDSKMMKKDGDQDPDKTHISGAKRRGFWHQIRSHTVPADMYRGANCI